MREKRGCNLNARGRDQFLDAASCVREQREQERELSIIHSQLSIAVLSFPATPLVPTARWNSNPRPR